MDEPLVSVVVGVYNKARYVGETLKSVLGQTYPNWELIVVDDCSTDGSLSEVERAVGEDGRVRIIRRETNSGRPAVPRNMGLAQARGEYIAFLDADDLWDAEKLAHQVEYMRRHPEYGACHCAFRKIDGENNRIGIRHKGSLPPAGDYRTALLERVWISISGFMVRRETALTVGGFLEGMKWRGEEDGAYFLQCASVTSFGVLEEVLGSYRACEGNLTAQKRWKGVGRDYVFYVHVYETPSLWKGCKTDGEMRGLLWDIAQEGCQYWRARGKWIWAAWFVGQMMRWRPLAAGTWRQAGGVLLRRR